MQGSTMGAIIAAGLALVPGFLALGCVGEIVAGRSDGGASTDRDAVASTDRDGGAGADEDGGGCVDAGVDCGAGLDAGTDGLPVFVVLSAFPAEMAPFLEEATVEDTVVLNERTFRIGRLRGVRVAIGLTGIGLTNATATTKAVLGQLAVSGVVFSGVAGSTLRIGDVSVPTAWAFADGTSYAAAPAWLTLAQQLVADGTLCLESCTAVPATGTRVCLDHTPAASVGGTGQSTNTLGGLPVTCISDGDDVTGCDVTTEPAGESCSPMGAAAPPTAEGPIVDDKETAAVAREAAARGVPFLGIRGVSDGADDPLGLPGYPAQFFAYYRLAARNSARTTMALLERLAATGP